MKASFTDFTSNVSGAKADRFVMINFCILVPASVYLPRIKRKVKKNLAGDRRHSAQVVINLSLIFSNMPHNIRTSSRSLPIPLCLLEIEFFLGHFVGLSLSSPAADDPSCKERFFRRDPRISRLCDDRIIPVDQNIDQTPNLGRTQWAFESP